MVFYLGLICILGGAYFLLVNFNIINKKTTPDHDKPIEAKKIDNLLIRIFSIVLCAIGLYLVWPESGNKTVSSNTTTPAPTQANPVAGAEVWTDQLKEMLTKQCIENGKKTAEEYPELVNDYCKCATEKITLAMTPEDYTKWMERPREEQTAIIRPIIQTCADIMTKLIELTQTTKPTKEDLKKK